jgi:hypothetical protein
VILTYNELISQIVRYVKQVNNVDILQMCGLAEGTNVATLKITTAIVYNLYNQQYSKAVTDNISMTACAEQAVSTFCYYLVSLDVSSNVVVTKGTNNTYALPSTPAGQVAIGAFKIVTDGTHTFTSGTTDLSGTGITATLYDIDCGIVASLINQVMRKLERLYNFEYMKVRTTASLVAGDYEVTNPFASYKYKELINAHIIDSAGKRYPELSRDSFDRAIELYPDYTNNIGRPIMIVREPTVESSLNPDITPTLKWLLRPTCDASYTLDMQAYQYSPDLDGIIYASNWLILNAPEVLLYGTLLELAPYMLEDSRIPTWQLFYKDAVNGLIANQKSEKYSGSALRIKFDDPLNEGIAGTYDINAGPY